MRCRSHFGGILTCPSEKPPAAYTLDRYGPAREMAMSKHVCALLVGVLSILIGACKESSIPETEAPVAETQGGIPDCHWTMGWDPWEPYQYMDVGGDLRGIDIELISAIVEDSGCSLTFVERDWASLLGMLRVGEIDLLTGATRTQAREEYAHFSDPYREESFVMYVRSGDYEKLKSSTLTGMLDKGQRIGVTLSYYHGDEITALADDPRYADRFRGVPISEMNYSNLLNFEVDGILEDPYVAAAILRRRGLLSQIEPLPGRFSTGPVHVMLSRETVTEEWVQRLNQSLERISADGTRERIFTRYGN